MLHNYKNQMFLGFALVLTGLALAGCTGREIRPATQTTAYPQAVPRQQPSVTPGPAARMRPAAQVDTDGIWYSSVPVNGPFIAMTFDDGPHPTNTPRLLDMLAERNIKATFYVVGQNVQRYPEIMRRMAAEGHEIGNHSWDHPSLTKLSAEGVRSQLQRTHDVIIQTTGVRPRTLRPPYGAFTRSLAARTFEDFEYKTIMWSVDPRDWADRSAPIVTNRIVNNTRSGSIVLAHDIHRSTIDAMPQTLDKLRAAGYQFVTVSQLINMENRGLALSTKPVDPRAEKKNAREHGVAAAAPTAAPRATVSTAAPVVLGN